MAGKSASIQIKILGDESGLKKSLGAAESKLAGFADKTKAVGQNLMTVGAGLTAGVTLPIVAMGGLAVKAFAEAEQAQAQLDASLKSTGATAWTSAGQIDTLAQSMQDKLAIDGDLVKSGASVLLTFTNVQNKVGEGNDIFNRATLTAADMSAKLGTDLPAANMLLGKALNDPIKGMGALRKAGVQLSAAQEEQVKKFVEVGDVTSAQKVLLKELETQFGGSAEAAANTAQGGMEKLRLKFEDIQESIGERLVPILEKLGGWLERGMQWWDQLGERGQTIVLVMAGVAAAIGPVVTVIGALVTAVGFIATPVGLVVAAIAALVAGFVYLYKTNDGFRQWVDKVVAVVRDKLIVAFNYFRDEVLPRLIDAFNWLKDDALPKVVDAVQAAAQGFQQAAQWIRTAWDWVWEKVSAFVAWFQTNVGPLIAAVVDYVVVSFNRVADVVRTVWPAIETIIRTALTVIGAVLRAFVAVITPIWNAVWRTIQAVVPVVWNTIRTVIEAALRVITGIVRTVTGIISGDWSKAWAGIRQIVSGAWQAIASIVSGSLNVIRSVVSGVLGAIGGVFSVVWGGIRSATSGAFNAVVSVIAGAMNTARGVVDGALGAIGGLFRGVAGTASRALSNLADVVSAPFRAAGNAIRSAWNSTIGGKGISIPDIPGLPGRGQRFAIPRLHTGGIFEAGPGKIEGLALLKDGERVLTKQQQLDQGGGAGQTVNVNVTLSTGPVVGANAARELIAMIEDGVRQGLQAPALRRYVAN